MQRPEWLGRVFVYHFLNTSQKEHLLRCFGEQVLFLASGVSNSDSDSNQIPKCQRPEGIQSGLVTHLLVSSFG